MSTITRLADAIWETPAALAARHGHPLLSRVLADGGWLRAWPPLAIIAPLLGAACGWYAATSRSVYEQVFTASMGLMVLLALVASIGALVGLMATIGYAVGDLVAYDHTFDAALLHPDGLGHLFYVILPLLTTYVLLGVLAVNLPLVATTIRRGAADRSGAVAGVAAGSVVTFVLSWAWVTAAPHVLRSTYSYQSVWDRWVEGSSLIFAPLLERGWTVVLIATAAHTARLAVETSLERSRPRPDRRETFATQQVPARIAQSVLLTSGFAFALVGAIAQTKGQFIALAVVCIGTAVLRSAVLPLLPRYQRFVSRVPLTGRAGTAVVVTYLLTRILADDAASLVANPLNSNADLVLTITVAAPLFVLLLPAPTRSGVSS